MFTRSGSTWAQQAYIKSSMTRPNVLFGYSIGLSGNGDTLAVAEYDADRGKGALYVLTRTGGVWSHQARIQADNAENGRTRSGIRWPSARTATPSRRARPTRTA